jgi:hypothetical protein
VALAAALLAVALAGLVLRSRFTPERFDGVVSIETLPGYQDSRLLERAWNLPVARTYPHALVFQSNPSACGPTALENVFKSLGAPPKSDVCPFNLCLGGLTLDALAAAAEGPRWRVTALRDLSPEQWRDEVRHFNDPNRRYVANFHRGPLFARGGGHHAPIGGWLEADDLVFVLDVNASFGPWLVPSERMYQAIDTVDRSSGKKRGLLRLELQ